MISQNTVLILGAGASAPYGFPTGDRLMYDLIEAKADPTGNNPTVQLLEAAGHSREEIDRLRNALQTAGAYSIDRFMQTNPNLEILCKRAIAAEILPKEVDGPICGFRDEDWYQQLVEMLATPDYAAFSENRVRIVTFNFDRSLERALALRLQGRYTALSCARVNRLVGSLPIIHVHGVLGNTAWDDCSWQSGSSKRYDRKEVDAEMIENAAKTLRIFPDAFVGDVQQAVADALAQADNVIFLGFGFHPDNVRKLELPGSIAAASFVGGTMRNLPRFVAERVQKMFEGRNSRDVRRTVEFGQMGVHQWLGPKIAFLTDAPV